MFSSFPDWLNSDCLTYAIVFDKTVRRDKHERIKKIKEIKRFADSFFKQQCDPFPEHYVDIRPDRVVIFAPENRQDIIVAMKLKYG